MRISDWSSDVCSSDLLLYDISFVETREQALAWVVFAALIAVAIFSLFASRWLASRALAPLDALVDQLAHLNPEQRGERIALPVDDSELAVRSEERRGGKECVSTCRSRGWPDP